MPANKFISDHLNKNLETRHYMKVHLPRAQRIATYWNRVENQYLSYINARRL